MDNGLGTCLELVRDALRERVIPAAEGAAPRQTGAMASAVLTRLALEASLAPDLDRKAFARRRNLLAEYAPYLDGADRDCADRLMGVVAESVPDADLTLVKRLLARVAARLTGQGSPEAMRGARQILSIDAGNRRAIDQAFAEAMAAAPAGGAAAPEALTADERVKLAAFLLERFPEERGLEVASSKVQLGGFSRSTIFVELRGTVHLPSSIVIRRDGLVLHSGNSVSFEFPILQRLFEAGVAVPQPLVLETSGAVLGRPFIAVSRIAGETFGDTLDVRGPNPTLGVDIARHCAALHRVPASLFPHVHGSGLAPEVRVRAEIASDHAIWKHLGLSMLPMDMAFAWLEKNLDRAAGPTTLVHRDIGGHNLLAQDDRVTAFLDWEIAVVGNPDEDLGYARGAIEQLMDWSAFVDAYADASGRRPSAASVDFYTLWSNVRLAVLIAKARAGVRGGQLRDLGLCYVGENYLPRFVSRVAERLEGLLG